MELNFEGQTMEFYSVFDTLGYLMTVAGPAPEEADKDNYLLPMGRLFCRWSTMLGVENNRPLMCFIGHVPSKGLITVSNSIG